ncbi:MAG: hypothetical protein E7161_04475 [Firmicutes bacterium]|nr:hypothetical protein [Bacillota bacterium]
MREFIQQKLEEIDNIDIGPFQPDNIFENNKTYFEYQIQEDYQNSDMDKNYTMRVSIIGYVVRKNDFAEDTLSIIDEFTRKIISKLKEINIRASYKDVSIDNGVQKIQVTGFGIYNQINNKIIS